MSELFDDAIRATRSLPAETREEIARMVLAYVGADTQTISLTPEEEADLVEAEAEVARGELATEAEVAAVLAKYEL